MISKWYHTDAAKMADMTKVSDGMIRSLSNGQVTELADEDNTKNTIDDPGIFGQLLFGEDRKEKEESMKMGHIELGIPVVNIQYTFGRKPVLAKLLGLTMEEMEDVVYYAKWIVTDPGDTELSYKQTMTEKEYLAAKEKYGDGFTAMTGAEAVECLLEKEQVEGREYMVLHCVPVIPTCMRYIHVNADDSPCDVEHYSSTSMNRLYESLVIRCGRLQRLLQMKRLPEIIIRNEKRMLQEKVDSLISNGARGHMETDFANIPCESLEELHTVITVLEKKKHTMPETGIDMEKYLAAVKAYEDYEDENFPEGTELPVNDPVCERLDQLEEEVAKTLYPFVEEYVKTNYNRYEGFTEEIADFVTYHPIHAYRDWKAQKDDGSVDPADIRFVLEKGLAKQTDMFIAKQLRWHLSRTKEKETA